MTAEQRCLPNADEKGSGSFDFTGDDDGDNADEPTTDETRELSDIDSSESGDTDGEDELNAIEPDQEFLYFVRRSKVGDERDERIEVWLRDDVLEEEGTFRGELANALGEGGEISKTNTREFTLKYAFEDPEDIAELMRKEGYGLTD